MAATTLRKSEKIWCENGRDENPMEIDKRFDLDLVLLTLPLAVSVEEEEEEEIISLSLNSTNDGPSSEPESLVSNMPTVVSASSTDVCPVCMEEFHEPHTLSPPPPPLRPPQRNKEDPEEEEEEKEESRGATKQMPCGHVYHSSCISTWLSLRRSCPLCRHLFLR